MSSLDTLQGIIDSLWHDNRKLSTEKLISRFPERVKGDDWHGWLFECVFEGKAESLVLLISPYFPYYPPIVSMDIVPEHALYPHVESDGVICLGESVNHSTLPKFDQEYISILVEKALGIIVAGKTGRNREDFLDEAETYWVLGENDDCKDIWILDNPVKSKLLYKAEGRNTVVLSSTQEALDLWMKNSPLNLKESKDSGVFIKLSSPLYPQDYPRNILSLRGLLDGDVSGEKILAQALKRSSLTYIVVQFANKNGLVNLGLKVKQKTIEKIAPKKIRKFPRKRLGNLNYSSYLDRVDVLVESIVRTRVTCTSSDGLLLRTTGTSASQLSTSTVAIIGCGALGGTVAMLLAQAGVRSLVFVDPDVLKWQNVGRHVLSSRHVGRNKAIALRDELLGNFYDYEIVAHPQKLHKVWWEKPELFEKCDLIISLTGSFIDEKYLNAQFLSKELPLAVIYGWVEAQGVTGHALTVIPESGCFDCAFEGNSFKHKATVVPENYGEQVEASCGSWYQPYSASSAMPVINMIVRAALNAITGETQRSHLATWIGEKNHLDQVDGALKGKWFVKVKEQGYEKIFYTSISKNEDCSACRTP